MNPIIDPTIAPITVPFVGGGGLAGETADGKLLPAR